MYCVKESLVVCKKCRLQGRPASILDTNSPDDLNKVELMFVGINPGKIEIRLDKPFTGRTGRLFRDLIPDLLAEYKWIFTNVVLCSTIDKNQTSVPTIDDARNCWYNVRRLIRLVKPIVVVLIGQLPAEILLGGKIAGKPMADIVGKAFFLEPNEISFIKGFVIYHPRFPMQRGAEEMEKYHQSLDRLRTLVKSNYKYGTARPLSLADWMTRFSFEEYDEQRGQH